MSLMNILYLLPKNALSRGVGRLMHLELPGKWGRLLNQKSIAYFAKLYRINLEEAAKPVEAYPSIGAFFIRELKAGARPLQPARFSHPADSRISQIGSLQQGRLLQAKGKTYTVGGLLANSELGQVYSGGLFATYYLCPTDYHRVHSPMEGLICGVTWIPGKLWPVNQWSTANIEDLFCVNERVVVHLEQAGAKLALVMVGATNVGKISLKFEPRVVTNLSEQWEILHFQYEKPKVVKRGEELGMFHMGSTVVMVLSPEALNLGKVTDLEALASSFRGRAVKMGEALY